MTTHRQERLAGTPSVPEAMPNHPYPRASTYRCKKPVIPAGVGYVLPLGFLQLVFYSPCWLLFYDNSVTAQSRGDMKKKADHLKLKTKLIGSRLNTLSTISKYLSFGPGFH